MATLQGEPVALAIRDHQTSQATTWAYRELIQELHIWVARFDKDFDLNLPTPVIAVAPLRYNVLANYRLGRSGIGARTTITFNEGWLSVRPFADTVATLIHELLHAYEEWHLGRETGGWYHSKAWREKMREIGIEADDHGHHLRILLTFLDYLRRYGVATVLVAASIDQIPSKRRQMPKWTCGCPTGNPARAVRLHAVCQDCQQLYRKVAW